MGYNGWYSHVGGSTQALAKIDSERILDLNQFSYSAPYWREQSAGTALEHTMYTSTTKLRETASANIFPSANNFSVYKFKDDPTGTDKDSLPPSQKISINYSAPAYNVYFQYDPTTNSYKRYEAQSPHIDRVSKTQITPKNVIAMVVEKNSMTVKEGTQGWEMKTVSSGKAYFYLDGKETIGTWKKDSAKDREIFYDASGKEMVFNRGQFWISVISPDVTPIVE
jgi:hypothetical protein